MEKMTPILKVGFVHTNAEQGFEACKPQIALKIAQSKMTMSLRGKRNMKGSITEEVPFGNIFVVPTTNFICALKVFVTTYCP